MADQENFIDLDTPNGFFRYIFNSYPDREYFFKIWLPNGNGFYLNKTKDGWKLDDGDTDSAKHSAEEIGESILRKLNIP